MSDDDTRVIWWGSSHLPRESRPPVRFARQRTRLAWKLADLADRVSPYGDITGGWRNGRRCVRWSPEQITKVRQLADVLSRNLGPRVRARIEGEDET